MTTTLAPLPEGCRLHTPGRCYLPPKLMAFRVGQKVAYRQGVIPGMQGKHREVVREWIRTRTGEHIAYCRWWAGHRWLYHSCRVDELMVMS